MPLILFPLMTILFAVEVFAAAKTGNPVNYGVAAMLLPFLIVLAIKVAIKEEELE
jgi:hypothetical protein